MSYQRNPKRIDRLVETLPEELYADLVHTALAEDLNIDSPTPDADITSSWVISETVQAKAEILARQPGVAVGFDIARTVFHTLDAHISFEPDVADGASVENGERLVALSGSARGFLAGERTALNFIQHLSGVATLTRSFVNAVGGTGARITDTRKTTPGFRALEKYAVRLGGGVNHRLGLYDAVLIKENHADAAGGAGQAVERARSRSEGAVKRHVPIYAEARNMKEVQELIEARPDRIMLDNLNLRELKEAVRLIRTVLSSVEIEATGGISLSNVRGVAETGVDLISVGSLTHSAPAFDTSMLFL